MIKIIQQPKIAFWRFRNAYEFDLPAQCRQPLDRIVSFYKARGARGITIDGNSIRFSRGNLLGTCIGFSECRLKQDVVIEIVDRRAKCEFFSQAPIVHLYLPPSQHYKELLKLERFLGTGQDEKPPARRRLPGNPVYRLLYWLYRLASGARHRARQRLTRAGWLVVAGISGAILMGMDPENAVAYQALPMLFGLLVVASASSWFFRARFSAARLMPRFGTVGQPFFYRVMVKNLTPKTQTGLALLEMLPDPRPPYRQWRALQLADEKHIRPFRFSSRRTNPFWIASTKEADVPAIAPRGEVEVRVELVPKRRGVLQLERVALARTDPFGLFRAFSRVKLPHSVLILPKRYPLPPIALPGTMKYQEGGVALASNIGRSEEFVSLREYRRGDPYRHIHWRSWAKTGKPIVKEFEDEFFVRHALILDTFIDDPRSEAIEEAVSVAASFACTLITQESLLDLLFVGPQAYCFTAGRGLAHADQMLEILASVNICPEIAEFKRLETLVLEHADAVSGCICVLLAWDEQRRKLIERLNALGVPLLVLLVVEPGTKVAYDGPEKIHILEATKIAEGLARL